MGSRFQFQLMTEEEARSILSMGVNQAEFFGDKIRAQHRLQPVATALEVARNRAYLRGEPMPDHVDEPRPVHPKAANVEKLRERIKPAGPWFPVPAMTRPTQCRSCSTTAYWIRTEADAKMLVDCDVNGGKRPNNAEDGTGVAHFATCPDAKLWSHKK